MTTITITAAVLVAAILLPALILLWATESPQQRAIRWRRRNRLSYRQIASRLGVSHTTARRWAPLPVGA